MGYLQKKVTLGQIYFAREALRDVVQYPLSPKMAYNIKKIVIEINKKAEAIDAAKKSIVELEIPDKDKELQFLSFLNDNTEVIYFDSISKEDLFKEDKLKLSISAFDAIELFLE